MPTSREDYSKLTVPQLRARCKELKVSGYSKLGRSALLEKLALHAGPQNQNHPLDAPASAPSKATTLSDGNICDSHADSRRATPFAPVLNSVLATSFNHANICKGSVLRSKETPEAVEVSKAKLLPLYNKRAGDFLSLEPAAHKKQKSSEDLSTKEVSAKNSSNAKEAELAAKKPALLPLGVDSRMEAKDDRGLSEQNTANLLGSAFEKSNLNFPSASSPNVENNSSKRFRPLLPSRKNIQVQAEKVDCAHHQSMQAVTYLDFSFFPTSLPGPLLPITIPPSLSQRKRINAWSIILSGLSDAERKKCTLVSRTIRYAVYLSAIPIINRVFGTRRLAQLAEKYNMHMTNFWPLYKQLRSATEDSRSAYMKSFLIKFFGSRMPIADAIWRCPEHDRQLAVALRFLMTRVWSSITINTHDIERTKNSLVIDAQEVAKGEIWRINVLTTKASSEAKAVVETFYVLEATCEVIGLAQLNGQPSGLEASSYLVLSSDRSRCLRVDWSEYVRQRVSNSGPAVSLLSRLRTTNTEEYADGISRLWLNRMSKEGRIGEYKREVAERYILACVVQNSVSGQWMSSVHMEQVFAGTASESDLAQSQLYGKERRRMNLFLPAHHLVESLHFTAGGVQVQHLHPALAIVQTPGREYFILRDNGMEVGCEEDGVYPVWMDLLDCDARGAQKFTLV